MTGNLTADPELRSLPSGSSVCKLRIACNTRRKDGGSGEWVDKPNYFNVTVWGAQGENAARYLAKGRPVAIDGRLEWREWDAQDGTKRSAVDIIADSVQFLGSREDPSGGGGYAGGGHLRAATCRSITATSSPHRSPAPQATTTFRSSSKARIYSGKARSRQASPATRQEGRVR